jgi:hypothetical protein
MEQDFQRACRVGDLNLIQKAVERSPLSVNRVDANLGWTPLYRTVICGHFEAARYLLEHGADANLSNEQQETPLHQAADHNQADIAEALLQAGANPNLQQQEGETPLHLAACKGNLRVIEVLLKFKANPNLCNSALGRTPLHYAVEYNHPSLIDLLVAHGASLAIQDKRGKQPMDLAVSEDVKRALKSPRSPSPMQLPSPDPFDEIPSISMTSFEKVNLSNDDSTRMTPKDLTPQMDFRISDDIFKQIEDVQVSSRSIKQSYDAISDKPLATESDEEHSASAAGLYRTDKFGDSEKQGALRKWLGALRLEEIADVLLDAGYDDIEQLTMQMQSSLPITLEMLKEIGVSLIGFRLRFLASLTEELKPSNPKRAKQDHLMSCTGHSQLGWTVSLPTLQSWLDGLGLQNYHSVFTRSGFDELEQLLFLMNTVFPITDAELKEIGVCKPGHRIRILAKLREDSIGVTYTKRLELKESSSMERSGVKAACELCLVM